MNVTVVKSKLDNLANAIGIKAKRRVPQTIDELIETVESIKTDPKLQEKSIDPKVQEQIITPDNGYDGLSSVTINKAKLQSKDIQPSNQTQYISSDDGYLGLKDVFVQAMNLTSAIVTPQPNENILTASDDGYDGFSSVTVQPIPDSYVQPTGCMAINRQGYYDVSKYQSANVISNLANKRITPTDSPQLVSAFPTSNCGLYDKYYEGGVIYYTFPLDINKVYMSTMHITLTITNNNVVEINTIQPVVYTRENMSAVLYMSRYPSIVISQSGTIISCYNDNNTRNVKNITVDYLNVIECVDSEKIYNLYLDRDNDTESKLYDVDFSSLSDNDTIYIFGSFGNLPFQYYIKWDSNKDLSFTPPSDSSSNSFKILPSQGKINISRMYDTVVRFSIAKCNQQYDGLSSVFVDAIPADYIGSGITIDPTPTITGATVNIPTGYYSEPVSTSVAVTTHNLPTVSIDSSTGLITATHVQSSGYISDSDTKTTTLQLSRQAAKTITPSETSQTAVVAGRYTTGVITVAPIPSSYIKPIGTYNIEKNGNYNVSQYAYVNVDVVPTLAEMVVVPTTEEQIITASYIDIATRSGEVQSPNGSFSYERIELTTGESYHIKVYYDGEVYEEDFTFQYNSQVNPLVKIENMPDAGGYNGGCQINDNIVETWNLDGTLSFTVSKAADGLSKVTVEAIPSGSATSPESISASGATVSTGTNTLTFTKTVSVTPVVSAGYVESGTASDSSISLTADIAVNPTPTVSGATVTIPQGYYSTEVTKSINTVVQATPNVSINTANGLITATATQAAGYVASGSKSGTLQLTTKAATTITPTESAQTAVNKNVYTLGAITVAAIPSNYIGSDIDVDPSPTVSGSTVTIPSGYYSEATSKSVNSGSATTPATTITANPSISINTETGLITASTSATKSVTPTVSAGYVSTGTAGTITASGSNTSQLTTVNAKTVTPTEEEQTVVNKNVYTLGAIKVGAISSTYVGSDITTDPTPTASGATVTIPAGYYSTSTSKSVATTTHPKPSASIDTTTGIVTASHSQTAGYVAAGTTTGTLQLTTKVGTSIDPTEEAQTAINVGTYALGNIVINAIPSTYVGSDITQDPTPTVSGATVNIPAGYYSTATSKSVSSTTQATPSISIDSTTGVVTATATQSAGYISAGSKSNTLSLDTIEAATINPTEEEQIAAAKGVYTLGAIKVGAISSTYVGSGITRRSSTNISVDGAKVFVPAGYYSTSASASVKSMTLPSSESANPSGTTKATVKRYSDDVYINIPSGYNSEAACYVISGVPNGSATAPASISGTAATVSAGTNTLTLTKTVSVTPTVTAGYISSGTAGDSSISLTANVTVDPTPTASGATVTIPSGYYTTQTTKSVGTGTASAPTSISGTTATVSTGTNTLTLTRTVSVTPVVSAGYVSSGTATNSSVSLTASVTTKAAATITPGTTNQTIAAGTYLTGTQTITGDADLVATNIASGVQIFGVNGTFTADATAETTDILDGKSAYVNGRKVQGTLVVNRYYTGTTDPSSSLGNDGDIYLKE